MISRRGYNRPDPEPRAWRKGIPFTAKIRRLAQRLVAGTEAATDLMAPFPNFEKLQRPLHSMAGTAASQALLSRALLLARIDYPRLSGVQLNRNGRIEGVANIDPPLTQVESEECEIFLIGNTVELLCTLIGEIMTLRFIQDEWPDASYLDNEPGKEGEV